MIQKDLGHSTKATKSRPLIKGFIKPQFTNLRCEIGSFIGKKFTESNRNTKGGLTKNKEERPRKNTEIIHKVKNNQIFLKQL